MTLNRYSTFPAGPVPRNTSPAVIPLAPILEGNPLAPSASGVRDMLFAFRSGGLQFILSFEGPGAPRRRSLAKASVCVALPIF